MKIAVIGKGGREQALVETLAASPCNPELYTFPGSDAICQTATRIEADGLDGLIQWMVDNKIDLCVAGEESYLVKDEGLANRCAAAGIPCWGPQKESAQLEASKEFAKNFLLRHKIPTGMATAVESYDEAIAAINGQYPTVLKFDGLAAGKGVAVCPDAASAEEFLNEVFIQKRFGEGRMLVEEFLTGPEISIFGAICDDKYLILCPARDYKRLEVVDAGPNTGGMGAVASRQLASPELIKTIEETIVAPTVRGLQADGLPYRGFLYFGLMLTPQGPKVIEYNCRFGDPECEAVMHLLRGDLHQRQKQFGHNFGFGKAVDKGKTRLPAADGQRFLQNVKACIGSKKPCDVLCIGGVSSAPLHGISPLCFECVPRGGCLYFSLTKCRVKGMIRR